MYVADAIYLVLKDHQTGIQACSLKNNRLKRFPKKMVERFPNLAVLNLEANELEELPPELSGWRSTLRAVNLARNRLSSFPSELLGMEALALADLSHNQITAVEEGLWARLESGMPKLKQLHLHGNPVAEKLKGKQGLGIGKFSVKLE